MKRELIEQGQEKQVTSRILAVTEEELRRLILDLHDGPVQQLFAAQSQISAIQTRSLRGEAVPLPDYQLTLQRVALLLEASLTEIRQFLGTFRPPDFAGQDLVDILQGLFLHHEMSTGTVVQFTATGKTDVSPPLAVKITLYRICQEALANSHRHAQAQEVEIDLHINSDWITLHVSDNGIGFQPPPLQGPEATERAEHIGLRGMRDRVDLVNGQFQLQSAPGKGTRIQVKVPIHV